MTSYAIIKVGGKQYRVREGEWLLVDRLPYDEGKTFHPDLLLLGGDGEPKFGETGLKGQEVTAKVTEHLLGKKVIVGKHKRRTGYKRRNGFRAHLTRIEVQSIGATRARTTAAKKPAAATAEAKPAAEKKAPARRASTTARKPAAAGERKAAPRKSTPKKKSEE
jgi:large subunit ribosomal protein L21